jgi:hypothetical protein
MKNLLKTIIKNSTDRDILIPILAGSSEVSDPWGDKCYQLSCGLLISASIYYENDADIAVGECVLSARAFERAYELGLRGSVNA